MSSSQQILMECLKCKKKGHTSKVCASTEAITVINKMCNSFETCCTKIKINIIEVDMKIHSGACTSDISKDEFQRKFNNIKLIESKNNIITFSGQ